MKNFKVIAGLLRITSTIFLTSGAVFGFIGVDIHSFHLLKVSFILSLVGLITFLNALFIYAMGEENEK